MIVVLVAVLLRRWQVLPALAIGLLLGAGLFFAEQRYVDSPQGLRPGNGQTASHPGGLTLSSSSDEEHFGVWRQALMSALERPVFGWGPGAGNEDSQRFIKPGPSLPVTLGAESVFLQVFEELGLVGLALYVGVFVGIGLIAWRLYRRAGPGSPERELAVIAIALTLGVIAMGTTTPIWSGAFVITYGYWWLAGTSAGLAADDPAAARQS